MKVSITITFEMIKSCEHITMRNIIVFGMRGVLFFFFWRNVLDTVCVLCKSWQGKKHCVEMQRFVAGVTCI